MSLINDMLTDLDKRQATAVPNSSRLTPESLSAVRTRDIGRTRAFLPLAVFGLVLIALGSYSGTRWLRSAMAGIDIRSVTTALTAVPDERPNPAQLPSKINAAGRAPSSLGSIRGNDVQTPHGGRLASVEQRMASADTSLVNLRLSSGIGSGPATTDNGRSAVREVAYFEELLAAAPPAAARKRDSSTRSGIAVPATAPGEGWVGTKAPAKPLVEPLANLSTSVSSPLRKQPVPRTPADRADMAYRAALSLLGRGLVNEGEGELVKALTIYPAHVKSRALLAARKIRAGRFAAADEVLAAGLEVTARQPQLSKMRARVLVAMDKIDAALEVLQRGRPPVGADPEYYAFHAALLQRVGRHQAAVGLYQNALLAHPSRGVWWMGLAISLEALGSKQEAVRAYTKARKAGLPKKAVRRFVKTRLSALNS